MNLTTVENITWASGFACNVLLLFVLVIKERWRKFAFFTTWIGFQVLLTITLFVLYRQGENTLYSKVYWSTGVIDFLLQLCIVVEMSRIVLRPAGVWISSTRKRFVLLTVAGTFLALAATFILHPEAHTSLEVWEMRADLFTSLMFVEVFLAMMGTANKLGLPWSTHVMRLGQGLLAWATIAVVVDALHTLLGRYQWFGALEDLRSIVWIAAAVYWIFGFWKPEREFVMPLENAENYLIDLHDQVQYDLSRTEGSRSRGRE
jgi:hypothetical protein